MSRALLVRLHAVPTGFVFPSDLPGTSALVWSAFSMSVPGVDVSTWGRRPVAAPSAATIPGVLVTVPLDASTIYAYVAVGTSATVGGTTVAVRNITGSISIEVTGGGTTVVVGNITRGTMIEMRGSITMKITVLVSAPTTLDSVDSRAGLRGTTSGGTTLPIALPTAAVPGPSSLLPVNTSALDGSRPVNERVPPSLRKIRPLKRTYQQRKKNKKRQLRKAQAAAAM